MAAVTGEAARERGHARRYGQTVAAALATICVSVSLYPVFSGLTWFWAGAGAAAFVAAAGILTRLRQLPLIACLIGGLLGLLLYLNLAFESARSLLRVIPTPSSLRALGDLAGQGFRESARYAPPVPELSGMVLLAAGGIGLTALLTDLVALRLRSAALAGLPLLLLFTEPFTLSVSRSVPGTTVVFCLATAGYLTMLGAEGRERIREWERSRHGRGQVPDTRALAAAGRRVGIASVVLALIVPVFVPGLHATRLFASSGGGRGGFGSGPGTVQFPDPEQQLNRQLLSDKPQPVLTYRTTATDPDYLQLYVEDELTGSGWQPPRLTPRPGPIPRPPGLADPAAYQSDSTTITLGKNVARDVLLVLPVPYPARRVSARGNLAADPGTLMVWDGGVQFGGLTYSVTSLRVDPSRQDLETDPLPPRAQTARDVSVPQSYKDNKTLRSLAEHIVAGAKTPYEKAVALQNWFTGGTFTYSTGAPEITNAQQLIAFLTVNKVGYCQQFAFAMAVLARLAGVPSQVVFGYTQGTRQKNGTWLVTTHDAHAWPELYFQNYGWLRFEPTPAGSTGQGTATAPAYANQQHGSSQPPVTGNPTSPAANPAAPGAKNPQSPLNRSLLAGEAGGGTAAKRPPAGLNPWELAGLSLLGLLVAAAVAPGCARVAIRRLRWRSASRAGDGGLAHAAWRELRDDLTDYRVGYLPSETPRALASRVRTRLKLTEDAEPALRRVTAAVERARYAASPASGATLRRDSAGLRRAIAASVPRRARWRARLFPSSVIAPVATGVSQVTDVFGRLNAGWPRRGHLGRNQLGRGRLGIARPERVR